MSGGQETRVGKSGEHNQRPLFGQFQSERRSHCLKESPFTSLDRCRGRADTCSLGHVYCIVHNCTEIVHLDFTDILPHICKVGGPGHVHMKS